MIPLHPERLRIVLVETQGDANIGAVARSMACFGASDLVLVRPQAPVHEAAYHWACHGREVLEGRRRVETVAEALEGVALSVGTSARHGERRHRMVMPPELVSEVLPLFPEGKVALVFGNEESGLDNASLRQCQRLVKIPTDPNHSSLNLAHTVSILLYELCGRHYRTELGGKPRQESSEQERRTLLEQTAKFLSERGYPSHKATLEQEMAKLRDIAERARLEHWEVNFLLGMMRHVYNFEMGHLKNPEPPLKLPR